MIKQVHIPAKKRKYPIYSNTTPMRKKQQEEFTVNGDAVLKKVKQLVHEGNVRKIILKNEQGKTLLEIPLTFGAVAVVLAPVLVAVGAIAALVTKCTIVVIRQEEGGGSK
jgi:hypothetical protein